MLYQMGAASLARRMVISRAEADELFEKYFQQFSLVESWVSTVKALGRSRGYVTTPFGRKVTVWELQSPNPAIRAKGDRLLVNAPIQGGAADYMKIAMVRAQAALKNAGLWGNGVMLTMNQHDSLTFEVHNSVDMNELRSLLQESVVFPVKGFPVMKADWEFGKRWGSGISWDLGVSLEQTAGVWHRPGEAPEDTTVRPEIVSAGLGDPESDEDPSSAAAFETAAAVPAGERGPRELCVELATMPTHAELEALTSLVASRPGEHLLQVRCPEGTLRTKIRHGLGLSDESAVSAAVGGAVLRWDEASVDISELSKMVDF